MRPWGALRPWIRIRILVRKHRYNIQVNKLQTSNYIPHNRTTTWPCLFRSIARNNPPGNFRHPGVRHTDTSIKPSYRHIIISSYNAYPNIITSYHHISIISPYHHFIIPSYYHITISSYHHISSPTFPKNVPATFRRIWTNVPGKGRFVRGFDINPGTIGQILQKVACEFLKLRTAQKSRG